MFFVFCVCVVPFFYVLASLRWKDVDGFGYVYIYIFLVVDGRYVSLIFFWTVSSFSS